jgi:tetratricopeptide (TPR) repeat protein
MMRRRLLSLATLALLLFSACSTQQNTWLSRHYQEMNTRFNVHFNGEQAYLQGVNQLDKGFNEDFSKILPMYQVSDHKSAKATSSSMGRAIEKCQKAIKTHSIRVKPKKKPEPKASEEAKRYYSQEEFNPFMDDVFMLMANAQFTKADFLSASATCSYIIRHFSTKKKRCDEAGILQARAYTELEWYYEAENILNGLNKENLTPSLTAEFAAATADLLIRRKKYAEALPYLEIASRKIHNKREKERWSYLLGQLYQETGKRDKAYQMYSAIPAMNPPYEMELSARIRQSEVFPGTDPKKPLKKLVRLSKSTKNTEYLDQVFYAMGNLYLAAKDTLKALESLNRSLEKSVKPGPHKLKTLLTLGDFYYRNERFREAEPCYTQAMPLLDKEDERYFKANLRSTISKELAPPLKTVFVEDSLQTIAKMPEKERLELITKLMKAAEKKAKEETRLKEAQETAAANENERAENAGPVNSIDPVTADITNDKSWYFYNPSTVDKGLKDFRKKWGKRALNDDWRRIRKTPLFENLATVQNTDSAAVKQHSPAADETKVKDSIPDLTVGSDDPTKLNYYLKNLPFTEEQLAASGEKIAEGLYKSGLAYREQLENDRLALQSFNRLENDYPKSKFLENAWYIKYLIYKQQKRNNQADSTRENLLYAFPDSPLSNRLRKPDYIEKLIEMYQVQDTLYAHTYGDYLKQRTDSMFNRSRYALSNYPSSNLLPKFEFLEAMELARTGHPEDFHRKLVEIRDSFTTSTYVKELKPIVNGMLAYWDAGRRPVPSAGYTNLLSAKEVQLVDSIALLDSLANQFAFKPDEPHFIFMVYDSAHIRINRLQFDVALYDFTNYLVRDYDLELTKIGKLDVLLVSGFENALDAVRYRSWIQFQGQKPEEKYSGLRIILVSQSNLKLLEKGVPTDKYETFFNATYSDIKPNP